MSQATQVAVAGPSALADPSRAAIRSQQHNIPRFLLKLYEIVNDPANDTLVKWSESGDSFYIFNQEKFAREILGKWFKHQNFSSFVRQLNLYGFRKISALQQGLLRTDNDSETIQFAHPNFHRGQPDLLALIQRKRNPPLNAQTDEGAVGLLQASLSQDSTAQGQPVDVRSIVEGINAIRRQQQAIAAELAVLKQSNDALWKEAIEARERHAKHEDTINRILKFLAGLFGRVIQGHGSHNGAPAGRLLLGDGRANHGEGTDYHGSDADPQSEPGSRAQTPFSVASERFVTVETPQTLAGTPASITEVHDHTHKSTQKPPHPIPNIRTRPEATAHTSQDAQNAPPAPTSATIAPLSPNGSNPEAMWQATLQQMLTSPAQFQQVLQTFARTSPSPSPTSSVPTSSALHAPLNPPQQQLQWSYPYQFAPQAPPTNALAVTAPPPAPVDPLAIAPAPSAGPSPQEEALLNNADRLNKTYRDAEQIRSDVDDLQTNLQELIHNMGLDPQNVTFPTIDHPAVPPPPEDLNGAGQGAGEFSFDTWLSQLNGAGLPDLAYSPSPVRPGREDTDDFSAFLDLPALDGGQSAASPGPAAYSSPTGTKRKIEVVEVPEVPSGDAPSAKKKR
ncbi:hypothetical protein BD311DRAFT_707750 [Dichomitus squalens]|uniref:HSF-type DNA-binding domain-containing protein n=1 Tax=Dichomitus squalens TaxID=114155 RepID=A0A4Q9N897_9APHY|nr:hypothetical protein BD311DRAFT_707750 [Dichomitus squalens]